MIQKLQSDTTFLVMSNYGPEIAIGASKHIKLSFDFDKEKYGYACIENIQCDHCKGGACGAKQQEFMDKWTPVSNKISRN